MLKALFCESHWPLELIYLKVPFWEGGLVNIFEPNNLYLMMIPSLFKAPLPAGWGIPPGHLKIKTNGTDLLNPEAEGVLLEQISSIAEVGFSFLLIRT